MKKKDQKGTILVGDGEELLTFYSRLKRPDRVKGIFCDTLQALPEGLERLGGVDDVPSYLDEHVQIQRIYCAVSKNSVSQIRAVQNGCKARAVRFCVVLPVINELKARMVNMRVGNNLLLTPASEPLSYLHNRMMKRLMDLILVLVFMLVAFPFIYIYKALIIKRKKRGPSFVTQLCIGPNGRWFKRVSFRTESESMARVFNVLTGNMSLVGPQCYELGEEEEAVNLPKRLERHEVKSGMFSWANMPGNEGYDRLTSDIWYVENWSLWLDLKILFKSILKKNS